MKTETKTNRQTNLYGPSDINLVRGGLFIIPLLALLSIVSAPTLSAQAQGTAFTYQGRLNDGATPANGSYDLTFALYDAASGGTQQGNTLTNATTTVSNGLFTVTLDFGNQFPGADRWLEIGVATNGGGAFATLAPRQQLMSTPYAIQAASAATAASANMAAVANSISASNILGTLSLVQLPGVIVTNGASNLNLAGTFTGDGSGLTNVALLGGTNVFLGTNLFSNALVATNANNQFSGAFSGNGSGLTSLNASLLTSGTVPLAQLPTQVVTNNAGTVYLSGTFSGNGGGLTNLSAANLANIALLTTNQTFSGSNTFSGVAILTNANNTLVGTHSGNGAGLTSLNATNLVGTIDNARLSTNVALLNGTNVFTGTNRFSNMLVATNVNNQFVGLFTGNGAALTNLAAANLSGTVGLAQLPPSLVTNGASGLSLSGSFNGTGSGLTNVDLGQNSAGAIQALAFTLTSQLAGGDVSYSVISADVNGDGKPDLIDARYSNPSAFVVFTNNGSGGFVASSTNLLSPGTQPRQTVAADINGDGKVDLLFSCQNSTAVVFTNNGGGGFVFSQSFGLLGGTDRLVVTNLNSDTNLDVAVGDSSSGAIQIWTNNGSGIFGVVTPAITAPYGPNDIAAADVNGDGKADLIYASANGPFVFTNNGSGGFFYSTNLTGLAAYYIVSADFNGDGKPDFATTVSLASNKLAVYTNNGSGGFALASTPLCAGTAASGIIAADMDGDGRPDLVVPNNGNSVSILINIGGGNFALRTSPPTGTSPQSAACADFNADGKTDLAAVGASFSTVYTYLNNGVTFNGTFVGNGALVTNLNATNLFGTVADERLSPNVALLNRNLQTFTGTNLFNSLVGIGTASPNAPLQVTGTNNFPHVKVAAGSTAPYGAFLSIDALSTTGGKDYLIYSTGGSATEGQGRLVFKNQTDGLTILTLSTNGNVGIGTTGPTNKLHVNGGITCTALVQTSDRNAKENFAPVSPQEVLDKVAALPITTWNFKDMRDGRHMGPMAQDFYAAFGLGGGNTTITSIDPEGVALAAIKGLNQKLEEQKRENAELKSINNSLEKRLDVLEKAIGKQNSN
jgi:hypothetical protein